MTAGVLCAVLGPAETGVVRALGASGSGVQVARRCADLAELLACAAAGLGTVAVVSSDLPRLDREAVRHLHGSGTWVVLVGPASAGDALGADATVDPSAVERDVLAAVQELLARGGPAARPLAARQEHASDGARASAPVGLLERPRRGAVVAVWGPTGAPGRTTVALNLAAELATVSGEPAHDGVLLVDADTYGGSVAQALGMLDEAPGVAAAVRAAAAGRLDTSVLAAVAREVRPGLRVLTGITRADRWPELTPSGLEVLWQVARQLDGVTVVDCGFCLEQDEALTYDTRAPRRNASTLGALAEADVVVVVGAGDPVGLQRLVRALADLDEIGVPAAVRRVVVNRVRPSASGPRPGEAISQALLRYAGVAEVVLVPDDGPACDAALLAARTLGENAPSSPARRALVTLAAEVRRATGVEDLSRVGGQVEPVGARGGQDAH